MKNYLKTPKIFRRSAPKICRIRRKSHFQRPQKYTYLGAFGVKLKIKFLKKKTITFFKDRKKQMMHPRTIKCIQKEKEMIFVPQFWAHSVINHGFTFAIQLTGSPRFTDVNEFKMKQNLHEKWNNFGSDCDAE